MNLEPDVIIIGAGGGGAIAAKELGEQGIKVIILDAGPWYGNKKWIGKYSFNKCPQRWRDTWNFDPEEILNLILISFENVFC